LISFPNLLLLLASMTKFFVLTADGETGPFTVAQLNRKFAEGAITGAQLCRAENTTATRPLGEQFQHMADTQEVVALERVNVAKYQQADGKHSTSVGGVMALIGAVLTIFYGGGSYRIGWPLLVIGVVLISRGLAQEKRGRTTLQSTAPKDEAKPAKDPPTSTYDY
jgi:hypothetical protein